MPGFESTLVLEDLTYLGFTSLAAASAASSPRDQLAAALRSLASLHGSGLLIQVGD